MINSIAFAQAVPAAGAPEGSMLATLIPFGLIFVVFYFLLILPQQKKAKSHKLMLENLKKGDRVVTVGGVIGSVTSMNQDVVTLQIADNVKIKVIRDGVTGLRKADEEGEKVS
jgi:preprotein translocase subunit YajC